MSEEALQLAEKRSERQRRRGKIYPSEWRVPKNIKERKKAILSDQCKEIEENNRMGKIRDLFKKIRDTKCWSFNGPEPGVLESMMRN